MTEPIASPPASDPNRSLRRVAWLMFTPVVLLAGIGVYHLISDRALARQKAGRDAEKFLRSLVAKLEIENILAPDLKFTDGHLTGLPPGMEPEAVILRHGADDHDIHPRPLPSENAAPQVDVPPELQPVWKRAEQAEFAGELDAAIEAYRKIEASGQDDVSQNARYRLGVLLLRRGEPTASDTIFEGLIDSLTNSDPLSRRAHWHLVNGFMTKRRTLYHPLTNVVERACHAWSSHPDHEARLFLSRLEQRAAEMRHNIVTPIVTAAIRRVERDDRARALSSEIHSPKWPCQSYALNETTPRYVMVRDVPAANGGPDHELLVVWRGHQIYNALWGHIWRMDTSRVDVPDNIAELTLGHSGGTFASMVLWTPAGTRSKGNITPPPTPHGYRTVHPLKTERVASISVGGFDFGARVLEGAAFVESNRRIAWFTLLILGAAGISGLAWWQTRRSVLSLAALNEQKSNFVSSVSHELRAPVAAMQLMAESLAAGKVATSKKRDEYYDLILHECRRLGNLVHNVLDYARIEQRRKRYEFEIADMAGLVANSVKLMEPAAAEHQVALRCQTAPVEAEIDGEAIQQAVINLIDNAIKFSGPADVVTIELAAAGQDHFELRVTDAGPGVPDGERHRIFDRFYRRENELRRETPGVGLGLSIVKHIVTAHSGTVTVTDADPTGSVFTIRLPSRQARSEA